MGKGFTVGEMVRHPHMKPVPRLVRPVGCIAEIALVSVVAFVVRGVMAGVEQFEFGPTDKPNHCAFDVLIVAVGVVPLLYLHAIVMPLRGYTVEAWSIL